MTVNLSNLQQTNRVQEGFAARRVGNRGLQNAPHITTPATLSISEQAQALYRNLKLSQAENAQLQSFMPQLHETAATQSERETIFIHAHWGFPCDSTKLFGALHGIINYENGDFHTAMEEGKVAFYSGNAANQSPLNFNGLATMYNMIRENIMENYNGAEQETRLTALTETLNAVLDLTAFGMAATVDSIIVHQGTQRDVMDYLRSMIGEEMPDSMRDFFAQLNLTPSATLFDTLREALQGFVREISGLGTRELAHEVERS